MLKIKFVLLLIAGLSFSAEAQRQGEWKTGERVKGYGLVAQGVEYQALDPNTQMSVAFDVTEKAKEGALSRQLETVARFFNMHQMAGLKDENVKAAIVVHGPAVRDMITAEAGAVNSSKPLIEALLAAGVEITVCGQSATAQGVSKDQLLPGVSMSLSAMTAHAHYASKGYSLNPF